MIWVKAFLQTLPALLRLFQSAADYAAIKTGEGKGRAEAISEALAIAANQIDQAAKARAAAAEAHTQHPSDDGGFDPDFQRED